MLTKAEVLAMTAAAVNELAVERVLGWTRVLGLELESGAVAVEGAYLEQTGSEEIARSDGSRMTASRYLVRPASQLPDLREGPWPVRVMATMAARGLRPAFRTDAATGGYACEFNAAGALVDPVVLPAAADAILRAALLAAG